MEDYTAEGWFIPNGKRFTAEKLEQVKSDLLRHGSLVTKTLYWKDKNDKARVLKAGEPFDREGRIVAVFRDSEDMLQVVCEHATETSNMVAPADLIDPRLYQLSQILPRRGRG